jgi:uncharacterized protein (TIGR00369 family)
VNKQHVAQSPADLLGHERLLSVSGLTFMEDMLAGRIALPAIAGTMSFHLTAVAPGDVTFRGAPEFAHTNPMGAVHGGWYGAILDSALGCAVMSTLPRGRFYTTLEYKVNLIRALPIGMAAEAHGMVSHAGRSTAVAEASLRGVEDGRLYASATTTCLIMGG